MSVVDMQAAEKEANQLQREEEKAEERRRAKGNKTLKKSHKSRHTTEKRKLDKDEALGERWSFLFVEAKLDVKEVVGGTDRISPLKVLIFKSTAAISAVNIKSKSWICRQTCRSESHL